MSDELPTEVLAEIFLRLPLKTLLICRCVSKSWLTFISSPNFVNAHLSKSRNAPYLLFRHKSYTPPKGENIDYYALVQDDHPFDLYRQSYWPSFANSNSVIVGSINGLICVVHHTSMFLWNLFIKKYVALPEPNVSYFTIGAHYATVGFGHDAISDDYKVVRLVFSEYYYLCGDGKPEVEVLSLKSIHLGWISVSSQGLRHVVYFDAGQVFINGSCHWIARPHRVAKASQNLIVYFDVGKQMFGQMTLPAYGVFQSVMGSFFIGQSLKLVECRGLLAVIHHVMDKHYSLWVMNEYGVADSWAKLLTVDLNQSCQPLGLRNNGELLLFELEQSSFTRVVIQVQVPDPEGILSIVQYPYDPDIDQSELLERGRLSEWTHFEIHLKMVSYSPKAPQPKVLRTCNRQPPDIFASDINVMGSGYFPNILDTCYYVESLILLGEPTSQKVIEGKT